MESSPPGESAPRGAPDKITGWDPLYLASSIIITDWPGAARHVLLPPNREAVSDIA